MPYDYRLAAGHVSAAVLNANSAARVAAFPGAVGSARWIVAHDHLITPYAVRERTLTNEERAFGGLRFTWKFARLNDAMWHHLYTTIAAGALTPLVTVKTRNRLYHADAASQMVVVQCRMRLPELDIEGLAPRSNGLWYSPVVIEFYDGVYAPGS